MSGIVTAEKSGQIFDYIVVGAGSAGCVIAARLAEQRHLRILLLEAGGSDNSLFVRMPAGVSHVIGKKTWDYETEPDAKTKNRRMTVAQGKVLGGSSSVNGMIYIRGQRDDYDHWESELGCMGWSYNDLLPYFRKAECNESLSGEFHGTTGPLSVSENRYRHPLSEAFVRAGQEYGLPYVNDFNGSDQEGVGFYQTTTIDGERASAAKTYLNKAQSTFGNISTVLNALVHKVEIRNKRAVGVAYSVDNGAVINVKASKEVIVCGGANGSPKILMLSGIGPQADLSALGITPIVDLPVGKNFHDHLHLSVNATTAKPISLYGQDKGLAMLKNGIEWMAFKTGVVTSNILEGAAFVDTQGVGRPDAQIHFLPVLDSWDDPDAIAAGYTHGLTLKVGHLRPKARGQIKLRSADPRDRIRLDANYLGHEDDIAGQIRAVKLGLNMLNMPSLRAVAAKTFSPPGPGYSDPELEEFVRATCKTVYHPVGTCRMGQDPRTSVVDLNLKVHGIEGLRVVDTSVIPAIPSGNTNAPTIALAEKAADLILNIQSVSIAAPALVDGRYQSAVIPQKLAGVVHE